MDFTHFTLKQDGRFAGGSNLLHQAVIAAAIGYDYDKAMEQCLKRRARDSSGDDTGLDGLEALARKRRKPDASNQRKGS